MFERMNDSTFPELPRYAGGFVFEWCWKRARQGRPKLLFRNKEVLVKSMADKWRRIDSKVGCGANERLGKNNLFFSLSY